MIVIITGLLINPLHACFNLTTSEYNSVLAIIIFAIQCIGLTDVILSHVTGYYDDDKEEAILDKNLIYK